MEPNDFQNNPRSSPTEEEKRTKKIIPFKKKEKNAHLESDRSGGAQIIVFPDRHEKTKAPIKRQPHFESKPAKSGGLLGLIILVLILALLLAL
jgi:hypothetical protein